MNLPDHLAGRQGKCPGCQNLVVIPAASEAAPSPAPAQQDPTTSSKPLPPGVGNAPAAPDFTPAAPAPTPTPEVPPQQAAPQPVAPAPVQPSNPVAPAAPAQPPVAQPPVINTQAPQQAQPAAPAAPVFNTAPPVQPAAPTAPAAMPTGAPASPFETPQAAQANPAPGLPAGFPQIDTGGGSGASPFPQINTADNTPAGPTDPIAAYKARQKGGQKKALLIGGGLLGVAAVAVVLFLFVFSGGSSNTLAGLTREVLSEANGAIASFSKITDATSAQSAADDIKALVPTLQDIAKRFKEKVANTSKEDLLKEIEALLDDTSIKNEIVTLIKTALPLQAKLENLPPTALLPLMTSLAELEGSATTLGADFQTAFETLETKIPSADIAPLAPKALALFASVMTEIPELGALMEGGGIPGLGGGFGGMFGGGMDSGDDDMIGIDGDGGLMEGGLDEFDEGEPENPFE